MAYLKKNLATGVGGKPTPDACARTLTNTQTTDGQMQGCRAVLQGVANRQRAGKQSDFFCTQLQAR